jgi:hypothetical protein
MAWVDPPTWDADDPWLHTDANQYVTDNTEYLYGQLSNAFVLNEMSTTQVTVNTTAWTNVMRFEVDADELAGANGYHIWIAFSFVNTTGSTRTFNIRLRYGGTTLATISSVTLNDGLSYYGVAEALLWETASNTQVGHLVVNFGPSIAHAESFGDGGAGTVDSSDAHNLDVDVQNSASSANLTFTKLFHHVHKLTAA